MNETDIRKYAELMKELELTGLEVTEDNAKVRLERSVVYSVPDALPKTTSASANSNYDSVKSPVVGIFYASPSENAEPYVSVGDHVKKGQTLCIVEAMKLMNEITAEEDGIILEICVADGQTVEYGTELFHIKR
jgi:acetyl-CoA carboxylase biotin carboxyl carrier protein